MLFRAFVRLALDGFRNALVPSNINTWANIEMKMSHLLLNLTTHMKHVMSRELKNAAQSAVSSKVEVSKSPSAVNDSPQLNPAIEADKIVKAFWDSEVFDVFCSLFDPSLRLPLWACINKKRSAQYWRGMVCVSEDALTRGMSIDVLSRLLFRILVQTLVSVKGMQRIPDDVVLSARDKLLLAYPPQTEQTPTALPSFPTPRFLPAPRKTPLKNKVLKENARGSPGSALPLATSHPTDMVTLSTTSRNFVLGESAIGMTPQAEAHSSARMQQVPTLMSRKRPRSELSCPTANEVEHSITKKRKVLAHTNPNIASAATSSRRTSNYDAQFSSSGTIPGQRHWHLR